MLLVLFYLLLMTNDVLVIKNGKIIKCESYELTGKMVNIRSEGKTFSIPESMVDWPRTKAAQEEYDAHLQAADEAQKEAKVKAAAQAKQEKIEREERFQQLIEKGIESTELPKLVDVRAPVKKLGNGLIVSVHINDQGPFQFLLDTGASKTVISPDLLKNLQVPLSDQQISMIGLAGKTVYGNMARLDSIRIGAAEVKDFPVAAFGIEMLNVQNVNGLLGQDYLDFFSVELNSRQGSLRLRGLQRGTPVASLFESEGVPVSEYENFNRDYEKYQEEIVRLHAAMISSPSYYSKNSRIAETHWSRLREIKQEVRALEGRLHQLLLDFERTDKKEASGMSKTKYLRCHRMLLPFLRGMDEMVTAMLRLKDADPSTYGVALDSLANRWNGRRIDYNECMGY